jgi:hypothetical protein
MYGRFTHLVMTMERGIRPESMDYYPGGEFNFTPSIFKTKEPDVLLLR